MSKRTPVFIAATILAVMVGIFGLAAQGYGQHGGSGGHPAADGASGPIAIPEPIKVEHEHLHAQLGRATQASGKTGDAARQVRQALADHFKEENELVMPLLGLLEPLAAGRVTQAMRPAVAMSQEVRRKLPQFLDEHRAIHRAVDALEAAAEAEGHPRIADFARRLRLHAETEEAVLYPAAVLVGERVADALDNPTPGADQ